MKSKIENIYFVLFFLLLNIFFLNAENSDKIYGYNQSYDSNFYKQTNDNFCLKKKYNFLDQSFKFSKNFENKDQYSEKTTFLKGFWSDIKFTFNAPFRWNKSEWTKFAIISGIAALLYINDQKIMSKIQEHKFPITKKFSIFFENFGAPAYVIPGTALLYSLGALFKNQNIKELSLITLKSVIISSAVVFSLKFLTHRHRPESGDKYNTWDGPGFSTSNLSFISGHSAISFSLATVISSKAKNTFISVLAYGAAGLTSLSRVHDSKHWISDTFLGAILGYFITRSLIKRDIKRKKKMD